MRRDQPEKVVLVCSWNGQLDRFFGKYKAFGTSKWVRIPGGVFPPAFNTKEKAMMFALEWYEQAALEHVVRSSLSDSSVEATWTEICDAYLAEVNGRMRGKDATRHEANTAVKANIRKGVLGVGRPVENDETRCLVWLRTIAGENIAKKGSLQCVFRPS